MNILILSEYGLYSDFSVSFVHAQAKAYSELGHRVRVLVFMPVGKRDWEGRRFSAHVQRREEDGLEIRRLRFLSLSNLGARHFNTPSAVHAVSAQLRRILDGFVPDIIHAHALGVSSGAGAWLKKKLDVPLVVTTHGEIVCDLMWRDVSLLKQAAEQADTVVCVSSMLQNVLERSGAAVPIRIVLNGFRIQHASSVVKKAPYSMIQTGYLEARKKADVTIRALAVLRERYPEATLEIIGSGEELERFQRLCQEVDVSDAVRFHGFLPNGEALAEMAKARFFVMPSIHEGFGIVYLEAMACGCITIGTEGEGIADLIVSGENGFLVPPDEPEAIVRTIEWCFAHPLEAADIAERGRQDALGLTWKKNAAQYIRLFQTLTERKQQ